MNRKMFAVALAAGALTLAAIVVIVSASSSYIALEPEKDSGASAKSDSSASGGRYVSFSSGSSSGCSSSTVNLSPPASDLATRVKNDPVNTCYSLAAGTYNFSQVAPRDGMSFIGAGQGKTIVNGSGKAWAFYGTASSITIKSMTLRDFNKATDSNTQSQGTIMGRNEIWGKDFASGWVIDDVDVYGSAGTGLTMGHNFTVQNSKFHDNQITGITGGSFTAGLIKNNEVYNNGAGGASGQGVNGAGIKVAIVNKEDSSKPLVVQANEIYSNDSKGFWCDLNCKNVEVIGNNVHDQLDAGIYYELSSGGVIRGNTLKDVCGSICSSPISDWTRGAILVANSADVLVENNTITNSNIGMNVQALKRPAADETWLAQELAAGRLQVNLYSKNITFRGNKLVNVKIAGASHATNFAGNTHYGTIKFEGNDYSGSSGIQLWFEREQYNLASWQSTLGFDK